MLGFIADLSRSIDIGELRIHTFILCTGACQSTADWYCWSQLGSRARSKSDILDTERLPCQLVEISFKTLKEGLWPRHDPAKELWVRLRLQVSMGHVPNDAEPATLQLLPGSFWHQTA